MERIQVGIDIKRDKADATMAAFARDTSDLLEKKGFKLNIKKPDLPLGRITGDFEKFQGSLDAATARVLAFTATTTAIYGLSTAFTRLFTDSIKLEKQLAGIQAILNTSSSGLQQFSAELFELANATGLSFDIAASAASEFARQGLSLEETLKATNAALVFSKIAGVDAAIAVENLTASINTFSNEALLLDDVSDIILSLDNAFAISAAGISDGLKRIGGVASESGLQLKEIASLISVVQQVSARGAPVISNGLKTIFTRLGRTKVQETLNDIGVATQNSNGEFRSQIDVLTDLSSKLETLSDSQRAFVLEQVAGVYQINTLQSTLKALSGEYSLYDKAVKIASDSAGNSAERLKILTATTDANIQRLKNNITQFLAETGKATVKPILDNFLGIGNKILESLNLGAAVKGGEEAGFSIGNVLLNGISSALSGPGTILIVVTVARLLNKITKDAFSALQTLAGLKKASLLDAQTQNSINQAIAQGNQGLVARLATTTSIVEKMQILDKLLTNQSNKKGIAQINQAVDVALSTNKIKVPPKGKAKGYMPNYALGNMPSSVPKAQEPIPPQIIRKEKMNALGGRYKSGKVRQVPEGYMNDAELRTKIPGGGPNHWILPPLTQNGKPVKAGEDFREKAIRTKGIDPYKAAGFIPNFVKTSSEMGRGIEGSFHRLTKDLGVKRFHKNQSRKEIQNKVENEFSLSKLLSEGNLSPGITGPKIVDTLDRALQAKSIRKEIIKEPMAIKSLGRAQAIGFGKILEGQMYDSGVFVRDLIGENYSVNPQGQAFLKQHSEYLSSNSAGSSYDFDNQLYQDFVKAGGKASIVDAGMAEVRGKEAREKIIQYKRRNFSNGFIPNFAKTNRTVGIIDGDVLDNPENAAIVKPAMAMLGHTKMHEYWEHLGNYALQKRKTGALKRTTAIYGPPGSGKTSLAFNADKYGKTKKSDDSKFRKTNRIPILQESDIDKVDEVIATKASQSNAERSLEQGFFGGADKIVSLKISAQDQKKYTQRRARSDNPITNQGRSSRALGETIGKNPSDPDYIAASSLAKGKKVTELNREGDKTSRIREAVNIEKRKIAFAFGAFAPFTKGHMEMFTQARSLGFNTEDIVFGVSSGAQLKKDDKHSYRTSVFTADFRKQLIKKATGAKTTLINSSEFRGSIPSVLKVSDGRYISPLPGSIALVGDDKGFKEEQKYLEKGFKVVKGARSDISGTKLREAIDKGDEEEIRRLAPKGSADGIIENLAKIKNRNAIVDEVVEREELKKEKLLAPINERLSQLPPKIYTSGKNITPPEQADEIRALRKKRDKIKDSKGGSKLLERATSRYKGLQTDVTFDDKTDELINNPKSTNTDGSIDIGRFLPNNPNAQEQFYLSQNRGNKNVEFDDKISEVSFKQVEVKIPEKGGLRRNLTSSILKTAPDSYRFKNKTRKSGIETQNDYTGVFERYAIQQANKTKIGPKFIPTRNTGFNKGNNAVDGFSIDSIQNKEISLLEAKSGDWNPLEVGNKYGRFLPENLVDLSSMLLPLFTEGVPNEYDRIKLTNYVAVPDLKGIDPKDLVDVRAGAKTARTEGKTGRRYTPESIYPDIDNVLKQNSFKGRGGSTMGPSTVSNIIPSIPTEASKDQMLEMAIALMSKGKNYRGKGAGMMVNPNAERIKEPVSNMPVSAADQTDPAAAALQAFMSGKISFSGAKKRRTSAEGFIPNFVSKSSMIGRGAEGSFHKLTDDIGVKRFYKRKALSGGGPLGGFDLESTSARNAEIQSDLSETITSEFGVSKLLAEKKLVPGVRGPKIPDNLERALRAKSIRKQIIKEPVARDSIGQEASSIFGFILRAQLKKAGLQMDDLNGGNYTLNAQGQKFIEKNKNNLLDYFSDRKTLGSDQHLYDKFVKSGGKATIIDSGFSNLIDPNLKNQVNEYSKKTNSRGFIPNFNKTFFRDVVGNKESGKNLARNIDRKTYDFLIAKYGREEVESNLAKISKTPAFDFVSEEDRNYKEAVQKNNTDLLKKMLAKKAEDSGYNRKGVRLGFYNKGVPLPPEIRDRNFGPGYYTAEDASLSVKGGDVSVNEKPNKAALDKFGLKARDVQYRKDEVYVKAQKPLMGTLPDEFTPYLNARVNYEAAINDAYSRTSKRGYLDSDEIAKARGSSELYSTLRQRTPENEKYQIGIGILMKEGKIPYDSIRGIGGRTLQDKKMSSELVVPNASQIKSAALAEYDDDGNLIPLSKRFDEQSDDIRGSKNPKKKRGRGYSIESLGLRGKSTSFAKGFIPNFSPPLSYKQERKAVNESVNAEMSAGYKRKDVKIGRRASLKTPVNPRGLAVFNKDEGTLSKGMSFAKMAKEDLTTKRTYGDSSSGSESITSAFGFIPNFATAKEIRARKRIEKRKKAEKVNRDKENRKIQQTIAAKQAVAAERARPALPPAPRIENPIFKSKNDRNLAKTIERNEIKKQERAVIDRGVAINKEKREKAAQLSSQKSGAESRRLNTREDRIAKVLERRPNFNPKAPALKKEVNDVRRSLQVKRMQREKFYAERGINLQTGGQQGGGQQGGGQQGGGQQGGGQQGGGRQGTMPMGGGMPMGAGLPDSDTQATKTPEQLKQEKKQIRAEKASALSGKLTGAAFVASSVTGMLSTPAEGKEQTKTQKNIGMAGEAIAAGASAAMVTAMIPFLAPLAPAVGLAVGGFTLFSKTAKSAIPSTAQLADSNKKLTQSTESQIASVQEAVKAQDEISQLRESGGDPKKIAQAQAKFNKALGGIQDQELVSTIVNEKSDTKKQEAIMAFQEKKTNELNFNTGNLATNEIIKKSREENTNIFGTKTKTTDFKSEDWGTFLNPIIDSIDFTKATSKEASAAIVKLGDGTMNMGDFISQFGSELGLSESQVKMASKTYGDLNTQFTSSSVQAMGKYAASLLDLNKSINETATQGIKGFSLDFQKVFDEGLKGLTLDTALINYQKFSKAGTNLGIDKNRLEIAKSSGSITEAQSITKSAEIETRQLGLENEKAGTALVSDAVNKLTALVPKDASIEQRSAILDQASSVLKGGGDLSSLENLIKQSLGAGDSSKEILSQIADINQEVVLGIEKLRIDQAEGVRSINTIAQDQLKESQRRSVAEIGRAALAGPPKYTNKLMNTGAVMETDAKIQKLRDKAEKSGGAKSAEGRKLLLEASNLEMQNDRVKYEDELAQAERYGKDNVVKRTSEGKSGAAQIQRNMAEDIGNKLRSLNATREKSGKAGIFSNEDIKKISEGIQIGGEGATESKRLLEEKLNNPNYAQDATVQGFAREIKDVGGKNSIFAGNAMAAAVSGPEKSLAQATGAPTIPTGPSVSSVTAGATAPVVAGTAAAGGGVPTLPSTTAVTAGAGAVAAVPTAIASTAMNPSSAALPNYASSTANITAKSLTGRGSEQADRLRRAAAVTQTQDYKSFEEERLRNQTLRQQRDVAKAGKSQRMEANAGAAGKIKASTRFTQVDSTGTGSPNARDVLIQDLADFQEKLNSGDDVTQTEFENLKASTLKDESGNARSRQEVATRNAYISQVESSGFKFTEDSETIKKRIEEAQAKKEEKAKQGLDTAQEDTIISNLQKRDSTLNQDYDTKILESDTRLAAKKERIDAAVSAAEGYNTDSSRFLTEDPKIVTKTKSKTPEEMDSQVKRLQGLEETAKLLGDGKKEDERIQRVEQDLREGKQVLGKDGKIERVKMSPEQVAEAQKQLAGFKEDKNVNTVARQNNKRETARLKASVAEDPVQYLKSLQKQRGSEPIQNTSRIDDDIKRSQDNLKNGALDQGEDGKVKLTPLSPEQRKATEEYIKKRMADKKEVEAKNQPLIEIDNKIKAATAQAQMSDPKGYAELLRRRAGPSKGTPEDLKKGIQSKKDQIASLEKINPISADEKNQLTNLEKETTSYDKAVSNTKELDLLNKSQTPLDEAQKKRKSELETTSMADMKLIESVDPRDIQSKKKTVANLKERQDPKEKIDALRKEIATDERSLSQEQLIAEAQKKADAKDPAKVRASYVEKLKGSKDKNLQGVAAKIEKLDKKKAELASLKGKTLTVDDEEELKTLENEVRSFDKADSNRKELDQLRMKGSAGTLTESDQERKKQLEETQADDAKTLATEITPQKKARMQELQGKAKNTEREAQLKNEVKKGTEDVARATDQNMGAINSELFKGQVAPIIMDQIQKPQDKAKVEAFNAKVVERQDKEAQLDPVNKNIADIEAKRKERGKVANAAIGFLGEDKDGKKQDFINKFTRGEITAEEANKQTGGALKKAYDTVIPKKEGEKFEDLNNVGNIKDEKAKKALLEKNIATTKKEEDTLGAAIKPLIDAVANLTNAQGAVTEAAAAFQNAQGGQGAEGGAAAAATTNINSTSQVNVNITGEGITPEIIEKLKPAILAIIAEHSRAAASEAGKPPPASPPPKSPPVTTP